MEKVLKVKDAALAFIKEHKKTILRVLAIVIVLIAILVLISAFRSGKGSNNPGNADYMGLATADGKWIYYLGVDDEGTNGIYKIKNNGKKSEKIASGEYVSLNLVGNYIYCVDSDKENLVKMKKNGKDEETLVKDIDGGQIVVEGKYVYYSKDDNLYRINTNGKDKQEKISKKDIVYYQVKNNEIYYCYYNDDGDRYIAKMKANGDDDTKLLKLEENESFYALLVKGNRIYYILSERDEDYNYTRKLYSMNKKGEDTKELAELPEDSGLFNMQEDALYYAVYDDDDDNYTLYSMKYKEGAEEKEIAEIDAEDLEELNVVGKWIFYVAGNDDEYTMNRITINGKKEQEL